MPVARELLGARTSHPPSRANSKRPNSATMACTHHIPTLSLTTPRSTQTRAIDSKLV